MSNQITELEARLKQAQTQTQQVDALNELAWELRYIEPGRAQLYGEQARELATPSYPAGLAMSLCTLGYLNTENGNFGLALSQSFEALEILKHADIASLEIDVLRNVSWAYRGFGEYEVALDYQMKALALARELGDKEREFKVLGIIASIYAETNHTEDAIPIEQNCLEFYRQLGKKDEESLALNNLAMSYLETGEYASALEMALAALNLAKENNFSLVILSTLNTIGEIYLAMQDQAQAMMYLEQAIAFANAQNATYDQYYNLLDMGKAYYQQNDVANTLAYLHQSLAIADQTQNRMGQIQCHELLAEVHEKQGNLTEALSHWKQFHIIKESVFNENSAKRIANLQVLHQVETAKRDAVIYQLRNQELLRENTELEKRVAERTAQLENALAELESFSYSISHDLRAPLRAVAGYAGILLTEHEHEFSPVVIARLQAIKDNGQRMGQLIDGLLEFLQSGGDQIERQMLNPGEIIQSVIERLRPGYAHRQVEISVGNLPPCSANFRLLDKIFEGLLDNAIKFTGNREFARIEISAIEQNGQAIYFVRDNGVGFDMKYYNKLFGVFQRLHHTSEFEGVGANLAIIQRIIQRHGGRIWAESEADKGATFYFTLEK